MEASITKAQKPRSAGLFNAPEWTRTTTGKTPHKALNLVGARPMRPRASTASDLRAFATPSDAFGTAFVLTMFSRHQKPRARRDRVAEPPRARDAQHSPPPGTFSVSWRSSTLPRMTAVRCEVTPIRWNDEPPASWRRSPRLVSRPAEKSPGQE